MINFLKRFVNLLLIIGTGIGVFLLLSPDYQYRLECFYGMIVGYLCTLGLNYLLFGKTVIWHKGV